MIRNVPKVIAAICIKPCSKYSMEKVWSMKNGTNVAMLVIRAIIVIRADLFSRNSGLYIHELALYFNKNKMV